MGRLVTSRQRIQHLLRRAGFGYRASELEEYAGLGLEGAVERLLSPERVDDSATDAALALILEPMAGDPEDRDVERAQREALVKAHGKLDPLIGGLFREQLQSNAAGYVMSTVPMAWCGLWVFQVWGLLLLPVFAAALVSAIRRAPLFLVYAVPALAIVGVHAAAANHYPRYNLMLVGPISVGSAWIICRVAAFFLPRRGRREIPT